MKMLHAILLIPRGLLRDEDDEDNREHSTVSLLL